MRRNKPRFASPSPAMPAKTPTEAGAEDALQRMLQDFWEMHQRIIGKIERCETPSPEEIAEATLTQRSLAERQRRRWEESAKEARRLLDSIDLEP